MVDLEIDVDLLLDEHPEFIRFVLEREELIWHVWVYPENGQSMHAQGRKISTAMRNLHKLIKKK